MSEDSNSGNGDGQAGLRPAGEVITIVLTRKPWTVQCTAPATELHATLAALRTAVDELEAAIRIGRAQQLAAQMAENAAVQAILDRAGKGVRR
jgi:hypothetical protein